MTLNTFVEIEGMMGLITDADVRRAESHLTAIEKGEVSLGVVHDVDAHRIVGGRGEVPARRSRGAAEAEVRGGKRG